MKYMEEFSSLTNTNEKTAYISDMLRFCSEQVLDNNNQSLEQALIESENRLQEANARIARAKEFYLEAKAEAETAEKRAKKDIYRRMQTVRDRIYAIGETVSLAGEKIQSNSRYKVSADELNNIIDSVGEIINQLKELDLWTEGDYIPSLNRVVKKETPRKTSSKKKKPVVEENAIEIGIQQKMDLE